MGDTPATKSYHQQLMVTTAASVALRPRLQRAERLLLRGDVAPLMAVA